MINASFNVMENLTEASIYYDTVLQWKIRECHIFIRQISNCLSLTMLEWNIANHCWRTHTAVLQR